MSKEQSLCLSCLQLNVFHASLYYYVKKVVRQKHFHANSQLYYHNILHRTYCIRQGNFISLISKENFHFIQQKCNKISFSLVSSTLILIFYSDYSPSAYLVKLSNIELRLSLSLVYIVKCHLL